MELSIVIPVYNSARTIVRALDSIKAQTYKCEYEIIIVNDGSVDDSEDIIKEYQRENKDINIQLISQANAGAATARNEGIKNSRGKYIAFLDSDDEWLPEKLDVQLKFMKVHPDVKMIGSTINGREFKSSIIKKFSEYTYITFNDQLLRNYFQPSTVVIESEILKRTGLFPEGQRYAEEGNFFFKILYCYQCVLVNRSLLNFGFNKKGWGDGGLSGNIKEMQKGEIRNLRFLRDSNYISRPKYAMLFIYSYLKYSRRVLIKTFNS